MAEQITLKKPFDAHVHLRRGAMLRAVTPFTTENFASAIIMPNTEPPIETIEQAAEYKKEILSAAPRGDFVPLMTFYLTKTLAPAEIEKGVGNSERKIYGVKSYPYGTTTNSQWGYGNILDAADVLKKMEEVGMPLLLHGEVHYDAKGVDVNPYEGEQIFIKEILPELLENYPRLKISLEHISSAVAADFIEKNGKEGRLVATVTIHHLLFAREDAESEPMLRCKPLIKSLRDRDAVRALVAKGFPFVFGGTDSAPHPESKKISAAGAFGVFTAPVALELYTQIFDELGCLDRLESFISVNGPSFYGVEPSADTVTLVKKDWQMTGPITTDDGERVVPMTGNETIHWKLVS